MIACFITGAMSAARTKMRRSVPVRSPSRRPLRSTSTELRTAGSSSSRQVRGDGHHHPEDGRDDGERARGRAGSRSTRSLRIRTLGGRVSRARVARPAAAAGAAVRGRARGRRVPASGTAAQMRGLARRRARARAGGGFSAVAVAVGRPRRADFPPAGFGWPGPRDGLGRGYVALGSTHMAVSTPSWRAPGAARAPASRAAQGGSDPRGSGRARAREISIGAHGRTRLRRRPERSGDEALAEAEAAYLARNAVDCLPEGGLEAKLAHGREARAGRCGSSSGSTRRRRTSTSATRWS